MWSQAVVTAVGQEPPFLAMLLPAISALASVTAPPSTGIVVHGFHCNAPRWEEVVWGDEAAQRLGRLPHAALLAWPPSA